MDYSNATIIPPWFLEILQKPLITAGITRKSAVYHFQLAGGFFGQAMALTGGALAGLMPGPLGRDIAISCGPVADELVAVAEVTLSSPLPGVPSWSFRMEARAVQETGE